MRCRGVQTQEIVHRDVKPSNVLVMDDGTLRLADFGLAKSLAPGSETVARQPLSSTGAVLGTPCYMAPEQEEGRVLSKRTDVFALGVLLAELASGRRPTPNPRAQSGSPFADDGGLKQLPASLRRLVLRCTERDEERRPADARAVLSWLSPRELDELESATVLPVEGQPVVAAPTGSSGK